MKREDVKKIFPDVSDQQLNELMALAGQDAEKAKAKVTALEADIEERKKAAETLSTELAEAKKNNASAADIQKKFDEYQRAVQEKEKKAEQERQEKEKAEKLAERFYSVVGEKKFSHEAIRESYLQKFKNAVGTKDFEGKSDSEIFHTLTKDDAAAFKTTQAIRLEGGANKGSDDGADDAKVRAIMGLPPLKK